MKSTLGKYAENRKESFPFDLLLHSATPDQNKYQSKSNVFSNRIQDGGQRETFEFELEIFHAILFMFL